jgi:hypothetical protein
MQMIGNLKYILTKVNGYVARNRITTSLFFLLARLQHSHSVDNHWCGYSLVTTSVYEELASVTGQPSQNSYPYISAWDQVLSARDNQRIGVP